MVSLPGTVGSRSSVTKPNGLAALVGIPGRRTPTCPTVVGKPVPTPRTPKKPPLLAELKSWPPTTCSQRRLLGLFVTCTAARAPSVANQAPPPALPPAPAPQNSRPSADTAPRTLLALNAAGPKLVLVSTLPAASMRATRRLTAVDAVDATLARPGAAA